MDFDDEFDDAPSFHRLLRKSNQKPKGHCKGCFNDTIVNGTLVIDYSGEIATLVRVGLMFMFLILLCIGIACCNKRQLRLRRLAVAAMKKRLSTTMKPKKKRGMSMLNDNDDGMDVGVEMSEMNPAAEAAAAELGESNGDVTLTREGMDGVRHELKKLKLDAYESKFEEHGYDVWQEVLRLPPDRFETLVELVGMLPNHADRFREQLREQCRKQKVRQAGVGAHEADEGCVIL